MKPPERDPVSWLLIEKGWRVVSVDGKHTGHVAAVDCEVARDIFDGLEVRVHALGHAVYVSSDEVAEIVPDEVRLTISGSELATRAKHS